MSIRLAHAQKWLRSALSYAALAGGLASVAWLSNRLEAVPLVQLAAWDLHEMPLVVVDAGHGGHDGGAVVGDTLEKNLALELALHLREQLQAKGLRVKMTRDTDIFLPLEERAAMADESHADAFVSLHLNTSAASEVSGIETYYTERKSLSAQRAMQAKWSLAPGPVHDQRGRWLAESLQRHTCRATQATDRGIKQRNYAVVSQTHVPAALIECGFLTHAAEMARLKKADYQKQLTSAIAAGVAEFLKAQQSRPQRGIQLVTGQPTAVSEDGAADAP